MLSEKNNKTIQEKAKSEKSSAITHAVLIGFLIGIIIYSIVVNTMGFFTLISLYFIYKLIENSKKNIAYRTVKRTKFKVKDCEYL
ncbi:MAG: FUSC family protein [Lutibacter sp.]|uniref:FUSC family protein n=1 Tax=Lutibacter sp. TaxID=1925666 RepID=UPI00181ABCB0|nr:FUSC family protein [Lutibacter sp.]MBT8317575.1 FUSC family protein [Lutibacter sp.]NNJ58434.1 FUSC family protein [Lutibacter sp.]